MTLLSAFAVLLHRYSGQDDIVVGSPIAGRQDAQLEQLIGFFVNSLIMRMKVQPQSSFAALLAAVRSTALEGYQHQDLPFERLVEELSPERRLNAAPIFQVVFALQNAPMGVQQLHGLQVEPVGTTELRVRIDLEVHAVEHDGVIDFHWLYARDLFDRWRMEQMARHYLRVLDAVTTGVKQPLEAIDLLGTSERRQILEQWNATETQVSPATLTNLFEQQVEKNPAGTALLFGEEVITYAELNARANRLARLLIGTGIAPETMVALALPRSVEMIVAVFAVLKAGAAYVPLDPNYPADRLMFMLSDSRAACIITTGKIASRLSGVHAVVAVDDAATRAAWMEQSPDNLTQAQRNRHLYPENPAYVIYTSGSTGKPKGVVVTHAGIPSLSLTRIERLEVNSTSRVLQYASLSFDVSVVEIISALTTGAALVLIRDDQRSGAALRDVIAAHEITHATLPPVVLPTLEGTGELPLPPCWWEAKRLQGNWWRAGRLAVA